MSAAKADIEATGVPKADEPALTGRQRSLANLKPWPKGVSGNAKGTNGRGKNDHTALLRAFLDARPKGTDLTRFDLLLHQVFKSAMNGSIKAAALLFDRAVPIKAIVKHESERRVVFLKPTTAQPPPGWQQPELIVDVDGESKLLTKDDTDSAKEDAVEVQDVKNPPGATVKAVQ
jgi:hypothetical protein